MDFITCQVYIEKLKKCIKNLQNLEATGDSPHGPQSGPYSGLMVPFKL